MRILGAFQRCAAILLATAGQTCCRQGIKVITYHRLTQLKTQVANNLLRTSARINGKRNKDCTNYRVCVYGDTLRWGWHRNLLDIAADKRRFVQVTCRAGAATIKCVNPTVSRLTLFPYAYAIYQFDWVNSKNDVTHLLMLFWWFFFFFWRSFGTYLLKL